MKIIIEIGDNSARLIGKISFVLGGFFILMALLAAITTPFTIYPSLILTVIGGILLFSGIYLMVKAK